MRPANALQFITGTKFFFINVWYGLLFFFFLGRAGEGNAFMEIFGYFDIY